MREAGEGRGYRLPPVGGKRINMVHFIIVSRRLVLAPLGRTTGAVWEEGRTIRSSSESEGGHRPSARLGRRSRGSSGLTTLLLLPVHCESQRLLHLPHLVAFITR